MTAAKTRMRSRGGGGDPLLRGGCTFMLYVWVCVFGGCVCVVIVVEGVEGGAVGVWYDGCSKAACGDEQS